MKQRTPQKPDRLWTPSPCTISFASNFTHQQSCIPRFSLNSIYHRDNPHTPKRVCQIGQPTYLLIQFRRQIREASRSGYQSCSSLCKSNPISLDLKKTLLQIYQTPGLRKISNNPRKIVKNKEQVMAKISRGKQNHFQKPKKVANIKNNLKKISVARKKIDSDALQSITNNSTESDVNFSQIGQPLGKNTSDNFRPSFSKQFNTNN